MDSAPNNWLPLKTYNQLLRSRDGDAAETLNKPVDYIQDEQAITPYINVFTDYFNPRLKPDKCLTALVYLNTRHLGIIFKPDSIPSTRLSIMICAKCTDTFGSVLVSCKFDEPQDVQNDHTIMGYSKDSFYIFKPNLIKYYLTAEAYDDIKILNNLTRGV